MSEEAEFAVVATLPTLDDLAHEQVFALHRSVLANIIRRMGLAREAQDAPVSAFTNWVSASPT